MIEVEVPGFHGLIKLKLLASHGFPRMADKIRTENQITLIVIPWMENTGIRLISFDTFRKQKGRKKK